MHFTPSTMVVFFFLGKEMKEGRKEKERRKERKEGRKKKKERSRVDRNEAVNVRVDIHVTQPSRPDPMCPSVLCLVTQSCLTLCDPMDCSAPGSSVQGDSPGKNTGVGCRALIYGWSSQPRSPALKADSLPSEPPGKVKNSRVGSLSLLQGIFPSQELNWSLLHCRQILHQLSYQGSPMYPFCLCQCNPSAHPFIKVPSQQIRIQRGTSSFAPASSLFSHG